MSTQEAIIHTGGKQYRVAVGGKIQVEKLEGEAGDVVKFDEVLMVLGEAGSEKIGTPHVKGAEVTAKILRHDRTGKVDVIKFKRRQDYKRIHTHRQQFSELQIESIKA